jgi:hypothetical protein
MQNSFLIPTLTITTLGVLILGWIIMENNQQNEDQKTSFTTQQVVPTITITWSSETMTTIDPNTCMTTEIPVCKKRFWKDFDDTTCKEVTFEVDCMFYDEVSNNQQEYTKLLNEYGLVWRVEWGIACDTQLLDTVTTYGYACEEKDLGKTIPDTNTKWMCRDNSRTCRKVIREGKEMFMREKNLGARYDPTGKIEICDGRDNDCDGQTDEWYHQKEYLRDFDGDGWGNIDMKTKACLAPPWHVLKAGDCDDLDKEVYPGAEEICDGKDNNCNGMMDEDNLINNYYTLQRSSCSQEEVNSLDSKLDDALGCFDNLQEPVIHNTYNPERYPFNKWWKITSSTEPQTSLNTCINHEFWDEENELFNTNFFNDLPTEAIHDYLTIIKQHSISEAWLHYWPQHPTLKKIENTFINERIQSGRLTIGTGGSMYHRFDWSIIQNELISINFFSRLYYLYPDKQNILQIPKNDLGSINDNEYSLVEKLLYYLRDTEMKKWTIERWYSLYCTLENPTNWYTPEHDKIGRFITSLEWIAGSYTHVQLFNAKEESITIQTTNLSDVIQNNNKDFFIEQYPISHYRERWEFYNNNDKIYTINTIYDNNELQTKYILATHTILDRNSDKIKIIKWWETIIFPIPKDSDWFPEYTLWYYLENLSDDIKQNEINRLLHNVDKREFYNWEKLLQTVTKNERIQQLVKQGIMEYIPRHSLESFFKGKTLPFVWNQIWEFIDDKIDWDNLIALPQHYKSCYIFDAVNINEWAKTIFSQQDLQAISTDLKNNRSPQKIAHWYTSERYQWLKIKNSSKYKVINGFKVMVKRALENKCKLFNTYLNKHFVQFKYDITRWTWSWKDYWWNNKFWPTDDEFIEWNEIVQIIKNKIQSLETSWRLNDQNKICLSQCLSSKLIVYERNYWAYSEHICTQIWLWKWACWVFQNVNHYIAYYLLWINNERISVLTPKEWHAVNWYYINNKLHLLEPQSDNCELYPWE